MKKFITFLFLLSFARQVEGQYVRPQLDNRDSHAHSGLHLELGLGPVFGTITDHGTINSTGYILEFSGTGLGLDFKIGGAVQENLILTFDILSKAISAPKVNLNGMSGSTSNDYSIAEVTYGAGLTYYMMPSDIFFSGTIGAGTFVSQNNVYGNSTVTRTGYGFSFQAKVGKHWWISDKWGIALSAAFSSTSAGDAGEENSTNYTDDLSSSRFMIAASIGLH